MSVGAPPTLDPTFTVLGVEGVPRAVVPTLRFLMHVSDPSGREVHAAALSIQLMIDPARRAYDDAARERLTELFGAPERWGATTHSFPWVRVDVLVGAFTGATGFALDVPCSYDLELAAEKYFYSVCDGEVPLSFHLTGTFLVRGERDRLAIHPVPWSSNVRWRMPVAAWKDAVAELYPGGGWIRLAPETLQALAARRAADGHHHFDDTVAALLEESP